MTPSKEEIEALEEALKGLSEAFSLPLGDEMLAKILGDSNMGITYESAEKYLQLITGKHPDLVVVERKKDEV